MVEFLLKKVEINTVVGISGFDVISITSIKIQASFGSQVNHAVSTPDITDKIFKQVQTLQNKIDANIKKAAISLIKFLNINFFIEFISFDTYIRYTFQPIV